MCVAFCVAFEDTAQEGGQTRFGIVGHGDDFRDIGRFERIGQAHIGDHRESDGSHLTMDRDDHFWDGGHADDIGPDLP